MRREQRIGGSMYEDTNFYRLLVGSEIVKVEEETGEREKRDGRFPQKERKKGKRGARRWLTTQY